MPVSRAARPTNRMDTIRGQLHCDFDRVDLSRSVNPIANVVNPVFCSHTCVGCFQDVHCNAK